MAEAATPSYTGIRISEPNPAQNEDATQIQSVVPLAGLTHEQFQELAKSVLVLIPYRKHQGIHPGICMHFGMWASCGLRWGTVEDPHGGFIEVQRGSIVAMFREYAYKNPEIRYLVMIDNDQGIMWDAPLRLAQHGLPVVTGVVCGYSPERGIFACFTVKDQHGIARFPSWRDTKFLPSEGVIEIEQCGGGLLCIRRDVIDMIDESEGAHAAFYIEEEARKASSAEGNLKMSEDLAFCRRVKKLGFKRYVDLSVHASHYKTISIGWPFDCIDENIKAVEWKPSPFDYKGVI